MTAVFQPQRASACDNTLVLTTLDKDTRNSVGIKTIKMLSSMEIGMIG